MSRGRALGLQVEASYLFAGLQGATAPVGGRTVRLDLGTESEIEPAWWSENARVVCRAEHRTGGGEIITEHDHAAGYRISGPGRGSHLVDLDGRRIRTVPDTDTPQRWQGLLAGQALPLAAVLQGLEVVDASAVVVAGQVMAFAGSSGAGKSALAAHLLLVGARFFADDVLALEVRGEQVVAHTGIGVVRLGERARATVPELRAQGADVIGRDGKTLVELSRDVQTLPLHSLYLLSSTSEHVTLDIASQQPDPFRLLSVTHSRYVRTPQRLRRQLELVGHLGARVRIFGVAVPRGAERRLARAIFEHAALDVLL